MVMEKNFAVLDPDDFDDYDLGEDRGGGGGGGKKKNKHRGDETKKALAAEMKANQTKNRLAEAEERPEKAEDIRTDITSTLRRIVEADKADVGVRAISEYAYWLKRRIDNLRSDDPRPGIVSESTLLAFRASGPGGQNVNKVHTCIDITHDFTGLTFQISKHRTQAENRRDAEDRMEELVDEHIVGWLDHLTNNDTGAGKDIAARLRRDKDKLYPESKKNKKKREEFDKLCDILERKEVAVERPWENMPEVLQAMEEFKETNS